MDIWSRKINQKLKEIPFMKAKTSLFAIVICAVSFWGCADRNSDSFRIYGDVTGLADEGEAVLVITRYVDENAERIRIALARISDGRFDLRGVANSPFHARLQIRVDDVLKDYTDIIIEPGTEVSVKHYGEIVGISADGDGYHGELISSWRYSDAFLKTLDEYSEVMARRTALREAEQAKTEGTKVTGDSPDFDEPADSDEDDKTEKEKLDEDARHLSEELRAIKRATLDKWANQLDDPLAALLSISLGGLGRTEETIVRLVELKDLLPKDLVESKVIPMRKRVISYIKRTNTDESLIVGEIAPEFSAPNLAEVDISLAATLETNQLVLLDFWASWCGPCIEQFPKLQELYTEYSEKGFEIVSVSLDDTVQDWKAASEEHEFSWINLGDQQAFDSEPAKMFGVTFIPKGYLINSAREIVDKDLSIEDLGETLAARLTDNRYERNPKKPASDLPGSTTSTSEG